INSLVDSILDDYQYTSKSGVQILSLGDTVRASNGNVYKFYGADSSSVDLGTTNFADKGLWKKLDPFTLVPTNLAKDLIKEVGLKTGEAQAAGLLVARNDVRAAPNAYIPDTTHAQATAGGISVSAQNTATLEAKDTSKIAAKGGFGGVVVTNLVLG